MFASQLQVACSIVLNLYQKYLCIRVSATTLNGGDSAVVVLLKDTVKQLYQGLDYVIRTLFTRWLIHIALS